MINFNSNQKSQSYDISTLDDMPRYPITPVPAAWQDYPFMRLVTLTTRHLTPKRS